MVIKYQSGVMVLRGYRVIGRVQVIIVTAHPHRSVRIEAKVVGGTFEQLDLILGESGQAGRRESLLLAQLIDAPPHNGRVIALC